MIQIPDSSKKIVQIGTSDTLGTLWSSQGIDLSTEDGRIRAGYRIVKNTSSADDSNLKCPVAFRFYNGGGSATTLWTLSGAYAWQNSSSLLSASPFIKDTSSGAPTTLSSDLSDMEIFNGSVYITEANQYVAWNTGGTWNSHFAVGSDSAGSYPHLLCQYANRMYMSNLQTKILSWDTSNSVASAGSQWTLTLPIDSTTYTITFMKAAIDGIWIGTISLIGDKGYIFKWDGSTNTVTNTYPLNCPGVVSGVVKDNVLWAMDVYGNLLVFNGGAFTVVAQLKADSKMFYNALQVKNTRFMHPNGMTVTQDGNINMLINTVLDYNGSPINERLPAGVYEYSATMAWGSLGSSMSSNNGFYCKHGIGSTKSGDTIIDYHNIRISRTGALREVNVESTNSSRNGSMLLGADFYADNMSTVVSGIFYDDFNDTLQKCATFVTQKLESTQVTDTWQKIFVKYKQLLNSTDAITLKYRTADVAPVEATITWTSTNTFTTTTNVSGYWTSGIGGEVEVECGLGAGHCSHITNISVNSGTYTVTVDETYTSASNQSATARFQKWTKITPAIADQISSYKDIGIATKDFLGVSNNPSTWIQFKVCMMFTGGNHLDQLMISSSPNLSVPQYQPIVLPTEPQISKPKK